MCVCEREREKEKWGGVEWERCVEKNVVIDELCDNIPTGKKDAYLSTNLKLYINKSKF